MGYAQYRCLNCGATKQVAFSCKSSFCLSCGKVYAEHWVDFISRRMFPGMVYRHIVLTVPDFLRNWFYKNPQLLSVLMQTGKKCMQDVLNSCAGRSLDIGLITVLQTAGRSGAYNPHLHILLTEGGITSDKTWRTVSYIPFPSSTESGSFICSPCSKRIFPVLKSKKTLTKHGPTTQKALSHLYIKKKSLPAVRGWLSIWQNTSFRLLYQFGVLNSMTDSLLHIGIEITKLTVSCMKQFPYPNLLDEWFSTFCRKGFSEFVITDFTAMYILYVQNRKLLAQILPSNPPVSKSSFRVRPRKPFEQLFFDSFGHSPFLCPHCNSTMELELITHPDYGILRSYELFEETPKASRSSKKARQRSSIQRPQPVVQLPLPLM